MNETSESAAVFVRNLADAARNNPISTALIGAGVMLLFASKAGSNRSDEGKRRRSSGGVQRRAKVMGRTAAEAAKGLSNYSSAAVETLSEAGQDLADGAMDYAENVSQWSRGLIGDAHNGLSDAFRAQPLALGAAGLVVGAAIAASLPTTPQEAKVMGNTSDFVRQRADEFVSDLKDEAVRRGSAAANAIADEARNQGLTVEGLRSAAEDVSGKIARVQDAAFKASQTNQSS